MIPVRNDITLVEGFIHTVLKTIQDHGDPEETDHLAAEANCEDFIAAMNWVKCLQRRALLLSDETRNLEWRQFRANVEGVMKQVARWAYEKYPEGLIETVMARNSAGGAGVFEMDIDSPDETDWTWALKAAMELEVVSRVIFKHCEQVTGMMHVDFMATALSELSF